MDEHSDGYRFIRAVFEVAQEVTSSLEVEQVLYNLVRHTTRVLEVKACSLRLLNAADDTMVLRASYGLSDHYLQKGPVVRGLSPLDRAALEGQVVVVPDVTTNPLFQYGEAARAEGITTVLCVPLRAHGQAIGVMRVYTGRARDFSEIEQELVQALAGLGALALINAQRFERIQQEYHATIETLWGGSRT